MQLTIPEVALVVLIGASGSGKSTFARQHFRPTEVLSSDLCRALVADDENDLSATEEAFAVLHFIAAKRLARSRLTVVDATNVQREARKPLIRLAHDQHALAVAIVFNLPERICQERNASRTDRQIPRYAIRQHVQQLRRSLAGLAREGFQYVYVLSSPAEVEAVEIVRRPLWPDRRQERGPFDIIGDVHGCLDELLALLRELGYALSPGASGRPGHVQAQHPAGRRLIFLGDLVDRGPDAVGVLRLVMSLVENGVAWALPGNHDVKLLRALRGRKVQRTHGLGETLAQLEREPPEFKEQVVRFLDGLVSHYVLDEGRLVVAHAGMRAEMQGRASGRVRDFALYGETTGETDEFGLPVRHNWADEYRGAAMVVYGHTPVPQPEWVNRTINIDTGCAFGGRLTALRYPERELVSVPAARTYYQPARPFLPEAAPATVVGRAEDLLNIADVLGKRIISTRLHGNVTIREENAHAALEVMSRFAVDPRWLVYLPPTMSPTETTARPGLLEHPEDAFAYYRHQGVGQVVCQEKHMGSRAVVIVCRTAEAAGRRFGSGSGQVGACYTRTGRPFFADRSAERDLLERFRRDLEDSGLWDALATDWVCLDCEVMPWSFKATELLRQQYAAVGAASRQALHAAIAAVEAAADRIPELAPLRDELRQRQEAAARFSDVYARYSWPVHSLRDLRVAPFHLLASESGVHIGHDHLWHMQMVARLARADAARDAQKPVIVETDHRLVDVTDPSSQNEAAQWWEDLTARGVEGVVVKPRDFVVKGSRGLIQPALKSRGREYLRIIYGPEYDRPGNLERLRGRGLGKKRSLALREFALGIEALERFVRREPLYRVHECVFGILALESEPVDPRL